MEAKERGFKFLNMEGEIKIPFFQRTYVWTQDNWEELLEEFLIESKSNNFLGAIILKQLNHVSGEPKQAEVIDGQQRLTTLSVLLKALYDSLPDESKKNCEGAVMEILYYKKDYASPDKELRINHSHIDQESYRQVFESTLNLNEINEKSHLILQCYKYFATKLKEIDENKKNKLLNKILNPENKMLVVIDLKEGDDEQSIFDTLNTAGVRLTVAEIVKNAIFKRVIELSDKKKAVKLYKQTWEETFLKDEEILKYWETEQPTGRLKRDNLEILLHCIGVIKGFYDPDKHTLLELSKLYKEHLKKFDSIKELINFINEIIEYAKIYREKTVTFDKSDLFSFDDSVRRLLHILKELEISTFHPFILWMFKNYQNNEQQIKDILGKLEKFVIQNMLASVENIKNYNKLCKQFIENPVNLDNKLKEISWEKVAGGLRNVSNRDATLLLFWIELHRRYKEAIRYDEKDLKYDYTLEHIMPIKWEENWNFSKVPHPKSSILSPEEQKQDRNEKINWLGNMTLLKSSLNKVLKNAGFETKMIGGGRKKGIKDYATLSITKDDIVKPFENGDKVWNENKIETRTKNLGEEIRKIWG
ncbi:MAG: DUF262 domain-containing HNH endonuclease family protein [Candidatus Omnitrophica bacterium]|nr:DUF262 domain-containing HNH endonuclease family protein [Candidatus Omnitrophota bacterium]